eukprot:TRINITY_DN615_c0_g1_i1.p1 TRINITY_DN615_c0_g1~~TRINITY_DN615_c0_g1_i1.p1  ORF type:complete len:176 (-),score=40.80 TRINITY_DN615_c0_g1_i1:29-556(-)
MSLVELVPAPWTSSAVVSQTKTILQKCGMKPVVLKKEVLGFIQPRLQYALLGEALRLVDDGVISPEDADIAVQYGLAGRWSFMGPFQTIDLNAPGGVQDYCSRYLDGIYKVLDTQDNGQRIKPDTINEINAWQRSLYTVEDIPRMGEWRDQRLLALNKHQKEQQAVDNKYWHPKL